MAKREKSDRRKRQEDTCLPCFCHCFDIWGILEVSKEFLLFSPSNYYMKHLLDLFSQSFLFMTMQMVIMSGRRCAPPASGSIIALVTWLPAVGGEARSIPGRGRLGFQGQLCRGTARGTLWKQIQLGSPQSEGHVEGAGWLCTRMAPDEHSRLCL